MRDQWKLPSLGGNDRRKNDLLQVSNCWVIPGGSQLMELQLN